MPKYRLKITRTNLSKVIAATTIQNFPNSGDYVLFHFRDNDHDFIIYDNTKNEPYKGVFTGPYLPDYLKTYLVEEIKEGSKDEGVKVTTFPQIGSDEVGFGDFFGPLVVVSAYLTKADESYLLNNGITDSKKLDDTRILLLGHDLQTKISHVKNIVSNPKYNELISKGYNMNKMKAMLHHNVLTLLARKTNYTGSLYFDRFTTAPKFHEYIAGMPSAPLVSLAGGESAALSIATASVLARFYFLLEIDKLNKLYHTTLPLGAGAKVDEFAKNFLKEKGPAALKLITKHNFRNFKDLAVN